MLVGALMGSGACAPQHGWTRSDQRVCERGDAPLVCFDADPDQPLELHVGGTVVLPGECARAPEGSRGGSLPLRLFDGRTDADAPNASQRRRSVLAGRRRAVVVTIDDDGELEVDRSRCDRAPIER